MILRISLLYFDTSSIKLVRNKRINDSLGINITINDKGNIILVTSGIKKILFMKPMMFTSKDKLIIIGRLDMNDSILTTKIDFILSLIVMFSFNKRIK